MYRFLFALVALLLAPLAMAAIELNSATVEEFDTLPGIGPAKARAIVEYRDENGPFESITELDAVPGIGMSTLRNIWDLVYIEGQPDEPMPSDEDSGAGEFEAGADEVEGEGAEAGADEGAEAGEAGADEGAEAGGAADEGAEAGEAGADEGAEAGEAGADEGAEAGEAGADEGTGAGQAGAVEATEAEGTEAPPPIPPSPATPGRKVNINTATMEELLWLPGIGATKAEVIHADRETNGPFASCDDLTRVRGIGAATIAALGDACVTQ